MGKKVKIKIFLNFKDWKNGKMKKMPVWNFFMKYMTIVQKLLKINVNKLKKD
jgi:hypothetical protein